MNLSDEEARLYQRAKIFENQIRNNSEPVTGQCNNERFEEHEGFHDFDFSKEEQALINRVKNKMNLSSQEKDEDVSTHLESNERDQPNLVPDTRERLRAMLGDKNTIDMSYEIEKCEKEEAQTENKPRGRIRRNVEEQQKELFKFYRKAVKTTTEWQEWRNISGVMKRFPRYTAEWITRNKHFKIVQEAKRKMKKQEIVERYDQKTLQLRKRYHQGKKYTRGEVKKVKGKMNENKRGDDSLFDEFLKPQRVTPLHKINDIKKGLHRQTQFYDGMSASNSELYYKDNNLTQFQATEFDSKKTVESNYINETLIRKLGLKLNAKERKELNKNLKKFEVLEHETLAPHFYEDEREDIFKNEEKIFGERATPLDLLDGLQVLPYVLREKTVPPGHPGGDTLEEVIRNCKHLDFDNFRKLGEQKLARYVLKVHDRRRKYKNITQKTTVFDDSVISHGNEEEFMKRITLKTVPGRLLYDHEKLYDKILRNKFKYKKVIYNDSLCWAYRELTKLAPVYINIIPKKNLTSLAEAQEEDAFLLGHMFHLCQKFAFDLKMREGYRVVINNGHAGNHNLTHFNILLIGGRQMRYPKYYDLSHFNSYASEVDHCLSTYGDDFKLSGRMADFLGSYGSLKAKRAKWLSSKYPKMCLPSEEQEF